MNYTNGHIKPLHGKTKISPSKIPSYPPPYPQTPKYDSQPSWKNVPSVPIMTITNVGHTVTLTWYMENNNLKASRIKKYELYICQKTESKPDVSMWKKLDNIDAITKLPMFCEIAKFDMGYTYYFILRAVDIHNRRGPFALQEISI